MSRPRALLAAPLLIGALAAFLCLSRGPLYLGGWTDPEYMYVLSGITIAEGGTPYHIDNPGTPLQVMAATVFRAVDLCAPGTRGASFRDRVLLDPERYLAALQAVVVAVVAAALWAAGAVVWRATGSVACAAAFQLTPFLSLQAPLTLYRVAPEPLLLACGLSMAAALVAAAEAPGARRWPIVLGILWGVGTATKVPFAMTALAPLAALPGWRARFRCAACALLTLAACLLPVWSELPRFARWLYGIATHTGYYGSGRAGVVDGGEWVRAAAWLLAQEPVMTLLAAATPVAAWTLRARTDLRARLRVALGVVATQLALVGLVAKHPHAHYLVPGAALVGATVVLALRSVAGWTAAIVRVLSMLALSIAVARVAPYVPLFAAKSAAGRRAVAVAGADDPLLVRGIRTSSPAAALQHGNVFAGGRYSEDLRRLYPGFVFWDWTGLHHFGAPVALRSLLQGDGTRAYVRYLGHDEYRPARLGAAEADWPRVRVASFGKEALDRVYPPPLAPPSGAAFAGFVDAQGLGAFEGPYPQWGLDAPVRWGTMPGTTLCLLAPGGDVSLALEGRAAAPGGARADVALDGKPVGSVRFPPAPTFVRHHLAFAAPAGAHELTIAYDAGDRAGHAVLYRSLALAIPPPRATDPDMPQRP